MAAPTRGSDTSIDRIEIDWVALTSPQNGYSSITTYGLYWNSGSGSTFTALVGEDTDYTSTSFLVTQDITTGQSYIFKVRAKNFWGWSEYSSETSIKAATIPEKPITVETSVDSSTGDVVIDW